MGSVGVWECGRRGFEFIGLSRSRGDGDAEEVAVFYVEAEAGTGQGGVDLVHGAGAQPTRVGGEGGQEVLEGGAVVLGGGLGGEAVADVG